MSFYFWRYRFTVVVHLAKDRLDSCFVDCMVAVPALPDKDC